MDAGIDYYSAILLQSALLCRLPSPSTQYHPNICQPKANIDEVSPNMLFPRPSNSQHEQKQEGEINFNHAHETGFNIVYDHEPEYTGVSSITATLARTGMATSMRVANCANGLSRRRHRHHKVKNLRNLCGGMGSQAFHVLAWRPASTSRGLSRLRRLAPGICVP